jgi:hypothetical protein
VGTAAGGLAALVGPEALKPLHRRLWGWFLDERPFRSARKLLSDIQKRTTRRALELWPGTFDGAARIV